MNCKKVLHVKFCGEAAESYDTLMVSEWNYKYVFIRRSIDRIVFFWLPKFLYKVSSCI